MTTSKSTIKIRRLTTSALVAAAVAAAGLFVPQAAYAADTQAFDVAGVHLGDAPAQVRKVLAAAGYRIERTVTAETWAARLRREADQRRGTGNGLVFNRTAVRTIEARGPHQEWIHVDLAVVPAGSSVVEIHLRVPRERMSAADFSAQVTAKYGSADGRRDSGLTQAWCAPAAQGRCGSSLARPAYQRLAWMEVGTDIDNRLVLGAGSDAEKRRKEEFTAALDREVPKTRAAAF